MRQVSEKLQVLSLPASQLTPGKCTASHLYTTTHRHAYYVVATVERKSGRLKRKQAQELEETLKTQPLRTPSFEYFQAPWGSVSMVEMV